MPELVYRLVANTHELVSLSEILVDEGSDLHVHDHAFLSSIPSLAKDFRVPQMFR